ncbi:hypothetical protein C5167_049519 [Papaver somniferum]|uniref:Uncharacterized protein n=1 Tax=Papaver somniferum TaxID=3469 RepID=A0A4Y7KNX4_PAPSO|nr:hypothetical protein C5167_049519 [Papaver somniferum]
MYQDCIRHIFGLSTNLWMAVSMRFLHGAISGMFDQVQAYAAESQRQTGAVKGISSTVMSLFKVFGPADGWCHICPVGILHCAQGYVILDIVGVCSKESLLNAYRKVRHLDYIAERRNYEGGDRSARFGGPIGRAPREFGGDEGGAPAECQPKFKV